MRRSTAIRIGTALGAAVVACVSASARPTAVAWPEMTLENAEFLSVNGWTMQDEATRFQQPSGWISRPPAALQQPMQTPPTMQDAIRRGGGPSFGIGEPGFPTQPPPAPPPGGGGGDPGGPVSTPLPTGFGLAVSGLLAVAGATRRRRF